MTASESHPVLVPGAGASEQPLLDLLDDVATFEPEVLPLEPAPDAAPLGLVEVVVPLPSAPVSVDPAVSPPVPEVDPLEIPALATPLVADTPLLTPDDAIAPLEGPVDASAPAPLSSDPARPESRGTPTPASTGVVATPVAPQKTR